MKALTVFCLCLTVYASLIHPAEGQSTPQLKFRNGSVWVTGLKLKLKSTSTSIANQSTAFLQVYTQEAFNKHVDQSIAGTYASYGDSISFTPNFSFAAGGNYHAVFGKQELSFSIPEEKLSPTFVEAVHPRADVLPENMLRMHICFSEPMMPGEAYDHIVLLTENGTPVDKAFLIIDQELWDQERKWFTLLFDPGRVKRGIQSNVDLGAPLRAGQKYQLVIDSTWRDAHGNFLTRNHTKSFSVTSAERTKLNVQQWKVVAPAANTYEELLIEFVRPLDYVLALKCITIASKQSGKVKGHVTLTGSTHWRFIPDQLWTDGEYWIEVSPQLEDVSGNNLNNAFDIDLSKEKRVNSSELVRRSFYIRPLVK